MDLLRRLSKQTHHTQTHRWLGGFHRVSTQVTSLLGRRPDGKLEAGHGFSRKTSIWKWEVALSARAGGRGLAAKQGLSLHVRPARPSAWGPAYLRPPGSFQARAFSFQSNLTLGPNRLCHKTRELRKAEVGWNYFYSPAIERRFLSYTGGNKFQDVLFCFVFSYSPQ